MRARHVEEKRLVVAGETGMGVFDSVKSWGEKLVIYHHMIDIRADVPIVFKTGLEFIAVQEGETPKLECLHFLDPNTNKRWPFTDAGEALRVLRVLDAYSLPKA